MGTKNNPGKFDCYTNAAPDEPMFILLGRDESAAGLVRGWAAEREMAITMGTKPESDMAMVLEARQCADAMDAFAKKREALRSSLNTTESA